MMIRLFALLSASFAAAMLLGSAGFLQNWTPVGIDTAAPADGGLLGNAALLLACWCGHRLLARPAVPRLLNGEWGAIAGRAIRDLLTSALLGLLMAFWRPAVYTLWQVDAFAASAAVYTVFALACAVLLAAQADIDPWRLLGISQAFVEGPADAALAARAAERLHVPAAQIALVLACWATPHLTAGHALLATFATVGVVIVAAGQNARHRAAMALQRADIDDGRLRALPVRLFQRQHQGIAK